MTPTNLHNFEEALPVFLVDQAVVKHAVDLVRPQPQDLGRLCSALTGEKQNALQKGKAIYPSTPKFKKYTLPTFPEGNVK